MTNIKLKIVLNDINIFIVIVYDLFINQQKNFD